MWEELLVETDANKNFEIFFNQFEKLYNECFPITHKEVSLKRFERPWLSNGLITSIRNKNLMFKNVKIGLLCEQQYKAYKNKLVNLLKVAKKRYYIKLFNNYKSNTKKLWHAINNLTKNKTRHAKISNIILNGKNLTSSADISEGFNDFFTNAANNLETNLPTSHTDPKIYLPPRNPISMEVPRTNISEITKVVKSLQNKKCRVNDFSVSILKRNCHLIAQPLNLLIIQSFQQGKFPNKLKNAQVTPLCKMELRPTQTIIALCLFSMFFF